MKAPYPGRRLPPSDQKPGGIYDQTCENEKACPEDEHPQSAEYRIALNPFSWSVHNIGYSIMIYIFYQDNKINTSYITICHV